MAPRVTVLLATYNDEPFLGAAIDSVLAQTFCDFELLIVIDASTDRSRDIVESYRDGRVRLLINDTNLGLAASLNRGLAAIASEYVARLDGNDLCFPERLARQVVYLDARPEVAVAGSQARLIDVAEPREVSAGARPSLIDCAHQDRRSGPLQSTGRALSQEKYRLGPSLRSMIRPSRSKVWPPDLKHWQRHDCRRAPPAVA